MLNINKKIRGKLCRDNYESLHDELYNYNFRNGDIMYVWINLMANIENFLGNHTESKNVIRFKNNNENNLVNCH
jgi:hypothetical protein